MSALLKRRHVAALQSADNASALQNAQMPDKIRIDFKRSFSITGLQK